MKGNSMKNRKPNPVAPVMINRLDQLHRQELQRLEASLVPVKINITLPGDLQLNDPVPASPKGGK